MSYQEPKPLFFDVETMLSWYYSFRPGKQYVGHHQMIKSDVTDLICITYCFESGPGHVLSYDVSKGETSEKIVKEFDDILRAGNYYLVGQNSDSFDIKHLNTLRFKYKLPPYPESLDLTEDTLKAAKKYFKFPSNRLDFTSKLIGAGGKTSMDFHDWVDIDQYFYMLRAINLLGKKAATKLATLNFDRDLDTILHKGKIKHARMLRYGKKDVLDTRKYFKEIEPYIRTKLNKAAWSSDRVCTKCGSTNITRGTKYTSAAGTLYQYFNCNAGNGHTCAGKASLNKTTGALGKLQPAGR